jgi:hypothetical protein
VNIITQNFGPLSKVNSSIMQITSEDTNDETIRIITKGLYFKNAIDNSIQLIINNEGLFILDLSNNIINLQDWMSAVTKIIKILGGIDGEGYSFGDLISDVIGGVVTIGGFLASAGVFTYVASVMKSAFIKSSIVSSITSGFDIGNDFKDKFIEQGYTTITEANAQDAFTNVSNDKLISFLWDNYSERTQVMNIKKHIDGSTRTHFQNIGGTYNIASAVPQNLFKTMFENQCVFKNNIYVPDIFFGDAFVDVNTINHDYYPGAFSLNALKTNIDTLNTNVNHFNGVCKCNTKYI